MGDKQNPVDIAKAGVEHAQKNGNNIVILDTAGRLHIDEDMYGRTGSDQTECRCLPDRPCGGCHDRAGCS